MQTDDQAGSVNPAHDAALVDVSWVVRRFGSISAGIERAEAQAITLLCDEHDGSPEWATSFVARVRDLAHRGDCSVCRSWLRGPITCDACVYDEMMVRAWHTLRAEHNGP